MITLKDYWMGRDSRYASELTDEIKLAATELTNRVNALLLEIKAKNPKVSSGWRPAAINAGVAGAAKKSAHMTGEAVDVADADGALKAAVLANKDLLTRFDLYMEDPGSTPSWMHLQTRKIKSGNRVFKP